MAAPRGRRARIAFSDSAAKQLEDITSEAELHALDRALVVISVDPDIGEPLPGTGPGPRLLRYTDDIEPVRVLYFVTALRTVVVVAYIEV
ncbi:hypothetical protein C0216_16605 [Streptomyces globosus]|uniref:Type II toxin-antitoxin system RelE/ParE family toxin n=1 Tax=Streptomyces globosus TaxID=68209 RepID=A0A344U1T7_9ACTN|nr:hypothetical protein [Streptomyces globosus]AXE24858.1 hypothetical protein C0216_16605 [Streptomyces globosus]